MQREVRTGEEFAGHLIDRVIGRGGVSVVYLAEHLRLGRKVALKVLSPHLADDPGFRDRFIRESRIAAGLDHPNIVDVYDAGEIDGVLYLSMRYVDGSDLGKVIDAEGPLDPWRSVTIAAQIASALDVAHTEGLVHRDVKPGNILLAGSNGAVERAFLADFGITKRTTTREALTRTGQFVGTVDYVAPEQILGTPIDGRTDVYSLGCVLYQSLTGKAPFPRPTDVATIYAHLHDPAPTMPDDLAMPGLDDVFARALAKEKEDRYPTCVALVEAARSRMAGAAPTQAVARPPSTRVQDRPPMGKRGRRVIGATVVTAVLLSAVLAVVLAARPDPPGDAGPSEPGPSGPSTGSGAQVSAWNRFPWREIDEAGGLGGQVTILAAASTADGTIVAGGHADDPDEDAAVWTRVGRTRWLRRTIRGGTAGEQKINDLAASGDRVAAVGYDSGQPAAWFSADNGRSWSSAEVPFDDGEGSMMTGVAVRPEGSFIAFGYGADGSEQLGRTWTSEDGSAWKGTARGPSVGEPGFASAATPIGDVTVAVGRTTGSFGSSDAAVWEELDGVWTQVVPGTFAAEGDQSLLDVASLGTVVVAVGDGGGTALFWTRDALGTWTQPAVPSAGEALVNAVVSVGDRYLLAGGWTREGENDAAVWSSTDGTTWKRLRRPDSLVQLGGPGDQEIRALLAVPEDRNVLAFGEAKRPPDQIHAQLWIGFRVAAL